MSDFEEQQLKQAAKEQKRDELRTMQDAVRKVEVTSKLKRIHDNQQINEILKNADLISDWDNIADKARLKASQREYCIPFIYPQLNDVVQLAAGSLALFAASTGTGKCFAKGTRVLMYDGSVKNVEDVVVGDQVMGADSTPRNVLSLGRGREQMYDIIPTKGDKYTVNESHILSLKFTPKNKVWKNVHQNDIINISVKDALKKPKSFLRYCKGYRADVEYPHKEVPIDPYFVGTWLGGGIVGDRSSRYTDILKQLDIYGDKFIPIGYLINSREVRLQLLAGLADSGKLLDKNTLNLCLTSKKLTDDVVILCRSLGFAVDIRQIKANYRIAISGDLSMIPTLIPRKQIKDVKHVGITIKATKIDDYYGFAVDGDHLFLLDDFTVVHNSTLVANIAKHLIRNDKKVLIIVNEEESDDVGARISCLDLGVSIHKYKVKGGLTDAEKDTIITNMVEMAKNNVTICGLDFKGKSSITTSPEGMKALLTSASGKFDAILIDYYQNVNTSIAHPGLKAHEANEMFANDLDYFKNTVGCPIILMAQIRRGETDYKDRLEGRRLILNKCTDIFELKTDKEHSRSILIVHKDRWLGNQGQEIPMGYRGGAYLPYTQQFEEDVANMKAQSIEKLGQTKDFNVDKLIEQKLGKEHSDMLDRVRAEMEKDK